MFLRRVRVARGRERLRSALVVGQIALAMILLVGAGLLLRSLERLQRVDPGFRPARVATAYIPLPGSKYADGRRQAEFFARLLERLSAAPGVEAAGATSLLPLATGNWTRSFAVESLGSAIRAGFPMPTSRVSS